MLQRISFEHFFVEIQNKLKDNAYLVPKINPYTMTFFKCGKTFLGLNVIGDILTIDMVFGEGVDFIYSLAEECRRNNIKIVKFVTSQNNKKVQRLADYSQALKTNEFKDYYGPDNNAYEYTIVLQDSSRFSGF